jgi:hypothetical protein
MYYLRLFDFQSDRDWNCFEGLESRNFTFVVFVSEL